GLRRRHLVDQVEVDVEEVGLAGRAADDMRVPDLLSQGGGHRETNVPAKGGGKPRPYRARVARTISGPGLCGLSTIRPARSRIDSALHDARLFPSAWPSCPYRARRPVLGGAARD